MMPAWPVFLYTNPAFGKYLLLPLFAYQATGQYPNKWAVHDMGMRKSISSCDESAPNSFMQVPAIPRLWVITLEMTSPCPSKVRYLHNTAVGPLTEFMHLGPQRVAIC